MFSTSSSVFVKHFAASVAEPIQVLVSEAGTELLLTTLFCLGFSLFRVSNIRAFFQGASKNKKADKLNAGGLLQALTSFAEADGFIARPLRFLASGLGGFSLTADKDKPSPATNAKKSRCPPEPRAARSRSMTILAQPYAQQVRSALQAGDAEQAERAIAAMVQAGHSPAPGCMVAFFRVVRGAGTDDAAAQALQRLPEAALPTAALIAVCDDAARCSDAAALRAIFSRANALGIKQAPAACEALLRGLIAVDVATATNAFSALVERDGVPLSEQALASLAGACAEPRQVTLAERCAAHARLAHGKLTLTTFATLLKVYVSAKMYTQACDLYVDMRADGVTPNAVAYGCMIRAAVECGRLCLARELFKESGNPDLLNCMSLIRAAGREKDAPKALRLLVALEKSGPCLDVTAYNCTLDACAACGDRKNGERLLRHMEGLGLVDVVSYNTYAKLIAGTRQDAEALLGAMHSRGIKPNVVTYNTLAKSAAGRHDLGASWQLVADMEKHDVAPDSFTCSILLKGMKHTTPNDKDVDRVLELVKRANIEPDEVLLSCLLDACMKLRDTSRLARVLDSYKISNTHISPRAAATFLRAYGHSGRVNCAWALWREVTCGPFAKELTEEVFGGMMDALHGANDLAGAASVWRQVMPYCGAFHRSPVVFATTVKLLVQGRRSKLAVDLYKEVRDLFVCTKVTYNTLIDTLVRQDDVAGASELFREMAQHGVDPDLISFSTLIRGYCARGDLERGLQLLAQMQRRNLVPDAVLFNSILDGCAHKQMRTLTDKVLADMDKAGVAPSNVTISILVKLYGRCGDIDAAFQVVEEYPRRFGFEVNMQVYTCLMAACISNGDLLRGLQVYEAISRSGLACDAKAYHTLLTGCVRAGDITNAARVVRDTLRQSRESSRPVPLDSECVESVLMLAARLGDAHTVALPLLSELRAANVPVSSRIAAAISRT